MKNLTFQILLDFIRNEDETSYNGTWKLYFVKRDKRSDLMGLPDIGPGKIVFDILFTNYRLIKGTGKDVGYLAQVLINRLFSQMNIQVPEEVMSKLEQRLENKQYTCYNTLKPFNQLS